MKITAESHGIKWTWEGPDEISLESQDGLSDDIIQVMEVLLVCLGYNMKNRHLEIVPDEDL